MTHLLASLCLLATAGYQYRPFLYPAPVWDYWYLLAIPLCLGIAIVYKSVRCERMSRVPREAITLTLFIIAVLVVVQIALIMLVAAME